MKQLILLGDSIIDNGAYVCPGEPDVAQQLQTLLKQKVMKRAVDGAICSDILQQTDNLEAADHLVLSAGGNDALQQTDLLGTGLVDEWIEEKFRPLYASLLDQLVPSQRPVLVLTIYNPCFAKGFWGSVMSAADQRAVKDAVSLLDVVILEEAEQRGFDTLDIRGIFTDTTDYANAIEPSVVGGAKLAKAISEWVSSRSLVGA